MSDDTPDIPRPISWGVHGDLFPEPPDPAWENDRTGRKTGSGLAITSLRNKGEWFLALNGDSWVPLSEAL